MVLLVLVPYKCYLLVFPHIVYPQLEGIVWATVLTKYIYRSGAKTLSLDLFCLLYELVSGAGLRCLSTRLVGELCFEQL